MSKNILEEIRKEQVVNATKKLIVEKGYGNFSMKDVAAELDMTTGIIYHYFENKEDLLLNVLRYAFRTSYQEVMEKVRPLNDFEDKLIAYLDNIRESLKESIDFWILLLNYLGQVQYVEDIQHIMQKFMKNIHTFLLDILKLGVEQGKINEMTSRGLADLIIGTSMGLAFKYILDPADTDLDNAMHRLKELVITYLHPSER